ncbi:MULTISPECIES: hypothetical protein [unclassified Paenibacillus]|uniref:hypothetical protein n=1 Tax=unclassified Paenibacillus TaxID=185978 RepID=UPI002406F4C8|nr:MULTISPECIES: hypothetical protein [unclassified Paenibacillus]MDF9843698.1 mannan endo-1,4-beta-mannosidase [Paenibacillus sp. PastF-2]MDF9850286.1 mannan endo-1,4-beta-mannosidase [Paenibacillus sp. PastM-2]MDF9856774.1 mannan endo-1,4-beta-mannosidase [Paenibacillus sp. PastF-1]MDH6482132.1 mannan endo-1,4-beta-mannosidase [Paenibacillus sp. PastH-2]MDH6509554.1 mannan endo-1,4-beta-mannosidase [Paenibacillus sp. PastM-3]
MGETNFVRRKGSRLFIGEELYRFAGPNIYWLGLDENVGGIDWPTSFRVTNALDTAVMMGANALRSHTLGVSAGHPKSLMPRLRELNEEAFVKVDFALNEIAKRGLRVIIPFVCNWSYYHGGKSTFTGWRGIDDENAFYTDADVISDYKWYIGQVLNRTNTISGVVYKDDPAIMAWELGNELNHAPAEWVRDICRFIKELDPNHLVSHGKQFEVDSDKLDIPELDIMDVHYYPADGGELAADAAQVNGAGKVFIAGEYGWSYGELQAFLDEGERNAAVSGTCFWSLFGHNDHGGYVQHYDGFTAHYPGSGYNSEHLERIQSLRAHAYRMRGEEAPETEVRDAPVLLGAAEGRICFRGVAGGAYYTLEKATEGPEGPWTTLIERSPSNYGGGWLDPVRVKTAKAYYRIKALSMSGAEGPYSDVIESEAF